IVRHVHTGEIVHVVVNDAAHERRARGVLQKADVDFGRVAFFRLPTDRAWIRDYGPIFLSNARGESAFTNWRFSGWAKYDNWRKDDKVPDRLQSILRLSAWKPEIGGRRVVLEGGSIDVNGAGLLLTTEECLLSSVQE